MTQVLSRDAILGAEDLKKELVEVPEWSGSVWVRELTGTERDEYEQSLMSVRQVGRQTEIQPRLDNAKARLAVKCIISAEGQRLFKDKDAGELGKKSAAALNLIVDTVQRLSGMTTDDIESLRGNSSIDPSEGSTSD